MKATTALYVVCVTLMSGLLGGCATNPSTGERELTEGGKAALREVAAIGIERHFREHPSSSVERVRAVLIELQQLPDITTVDGLKSIVQARISEKVSDPYDQRDFTRLLNVIAPLLSEYVGAGELEGDAVVRVRDFLGYLAAALPQQRTTWWTELEHQVERVAAAASQRVDSLLGL